MMACLIRKLLCRNAGFMELLLHAVRITSRALTTAHDYETLRLPV